MKNIGIRSELLGFWTLSIVQYCRKQETQRFGNWSYYRPQVRGGVPTHLGPLERVNLNHWTTPVRFNTAI
jgi:hypothetical protein